MKEEGGPLLPHRRAQEGDRTGQGAASNRRVPRRAAGAGVGDIRRASSSSSSRSLAGRPSLAGPLAVGGRRWRRDLGGLGRQPWHKDREGKAGRRRQRKGEREGEPGLVDSGRERQDSLVDSAEFPKEGRSSALCARARSVGGRRRLERAQEGETYAFQRAQARQTRDAVAVISASANPVLPAKLQ